MCVPLVIISALRPDYLAQLLQSLDRQYPPPAQIVSERHLFIHRHERNGVGTAFQQTTELAQRHNFTIKIFDGPWDSSVAVNANANAAWYAMMRYAFHERGFHEIFVVEDDVILAPDALQTLAALFAEKRRRTDVAAICLGGWSGENRVNAEANTILAVRSVHFQAMAYTMSAEYFAIVSSAKAHSNTRVPDWSEEIPKLVREPLIMLTPSVSRMQHIGAEGMGQNGNGSTRKVESRPPWEDWRAEIEVPKSEEYFVLDPQEVTDVFGLVCKPLVSRCAHSSERYPLKARMRKSPPVRREP